MEAVDTQPPKLVIATHRTSGENQMVSENIALIKGNVFDNIGVSKVFINGK